MKLKFDILPQPDDTTCGPTSLHSVYRYFKHPISIDQVIEQTDSLEEGGTLAVHLAIHALKQGFKAQIYTYNLQLFDPTWFKQPAVDLEKKIRAQMKAKRDKKLRLASETYLEFLRLGGKIKYKELTSALLLSYLNKSVPILTGLSSTYLYQSAREEPTTCQEDDVKGTPTGHFVVLCGYDKEKREVLIADPYEANPFSKKRIYSVPISRAVGAILLGIVTYDANLLVIQPSK